MVRALITSPRLRLKRIGLAGRGQQFQHAGLLIVAFALTTITGCAIVPRSRMDECQQLTQSLRADNARLKDRVLALQSQNRDYAERAVDDGRRLAIQDEAIQRLEHSVQAYQDDRTRLEAAYNQLVSTSGGKEPGRGSAKIDDSRTARGEGPASKTP